MWARNDKDSISDNICGKVRNTKETPLKQVLVLT